MNKVKVCYIWDEDLTKQCDRLPAVPGRASLVHNLITAYNIIENVKVVRSSPSTYNDLKVFHSELYLDHLTSFTNIDEEYMSSTQDEEHGIGYDCPPVSNMFELVSMIAGGSITAARCLVLGLADVAINWYGGWHHAQRSGADGFCYVNDIVLAIEKLKPKFPKVLYIDLDVHHGNGVQDAYNLSKSVFTLSFHKYEPGFYPGTGNAEDIGNLSGTGYSANVPLQASYSDTTLDYVFEKVFEKVYSLFCPAAMVVQCGADALAHDPHGGAGLTIQGYCSCIQRVLDKRKPTILLGGGGYKHPNAARLWTSLTALVTGVELDENIPEHENWTSYGPDYMLPVQPTLARDANKKSYLDNCLSTIIGNLEKYLGNEDPEMNALESKRRKTDSQTLEGNRTVNKVDDTKAKLNEDIAIKPKDKASSCTKTSVIDIYDFTED
ncbi:hypothetical protein O0L34_g15005 [Tuta absoluta]|nr:hypothetical protein O0L34_g15005 [Tuta absoluta]